MKIRDIGSTNLRCIACSHEWRVNSYISKSKEGPFIKRSGMIISCPQCNGCRNLKIMSHLRKDFLDMANMDIALPYVLKNEGEGYEGPPNIDQPTHSGIIAADVAKYRNVDIRSITINMMMALTQEEIRDIYLQDYWNKMRLGEINDQPIATAIFDCGVNRGIGIGIRYAQMSCNKKGAGLTIDGAMGPKTVEAINQQTRGTFIQNLVHLMDAGYQAIADSKPYDVKYLNGWLARSNRLLTLI